MLITDAWLKKHRACADAIRFIKKQSSREELQLIQAAIEANHADWVFWYLCKKLSKEDALKFAINAAKLVLPIFENRFPKDTRPRKAIEAAESGVGAAAYTTADAAYAAAYSAYSSYSADAAARAARAAAYAAAYAAYAIADAIADAYTAASYAADAARAAYAAYAAANKETKKQIIDFGISLL